MGRRQLGRASLGRLLPASVAVVLIGVVLAVLHVGERDAASSPPGPDTPVEAAAGSGPPASESGYEHEARALADALAAFSTAAMLLRDHEPLVDGSAGLEEAAAVLAEVERRSERAGADHRGLALVAGAVLDRWSVLRPLALSEGTAVEGVLALQALGREAGVRAAEVTSVLDTLSGRARREAVEAAVSRPWPPPGHEGEDTPA